MSIADRSRSRYGSPTAAKAESNESGQSGDVDEAKDDSKRSEGADGEELEPVVHLGIEARRTPAEQCAGSRR